MPKIPFVELKNKIRTMHSDAHSPISARESHRLAQGIVLSEFAAQFADAAEAYTRGNADETGEQAVDNVLIEYLRKYGSLTAPPSRSVNRTDLTETLPEPLGRAA